MAVKRAAGALAALFEDDGEIAGLPFVAVAKALTAALQRHAGHKEVQRSACDALWQLCFGHPALRAELRRDASVLSTVRAAAGVNPDLKGDSNNQDLFDWFNYLNYQDLLDWLKPCLWSEQTAVY